MRALLALITLAATPAWAVEVPSGQPISLQEVLIDSVGQQTWLRFRFIAPEIARDGGSVGYDIAAEDMTHLCDTLALPYIAEYELQADVVVISLADRATEFAVPDPDATQFFEAFQPGDSICILDEF